MSDGYKSEDHVDCWNRTTHMGELVSNDDHMTRDETQAMAYTLWVVGFRAGRPLLGYAIDFGIKVIHRELMERLAS